MKNRKVFAFGMGTANKGEQNQLIGALRAISELNNHRFDIEKQVLLPIGVDNLLEMKDNISFFQFKNYKKFKEYLYAMLDEYFMKTKNIPQVFVKVFSHGENEKAFVNADMMCKVIKEYYKEKNLGYIFTCVITSRYYKYDFVDLINIPKHLLNFHSRIRLLQNKEMKKKTLITVGTINDCSKELIEKKYKKLCQNLRKLKNDKDVKSIIMKLYKFLEDKPHIVFCLGGRVDGTEIRFDVNYVSKIYQEALRLKNLGYGILFVSGPRTPNDVCDYLFEKTSSDDEILFCNGKMIAKDNNERQEKYWRIYSGKYEKAFVKMEKIGNVYPGILNIDNTIVVHTFDSFSGCETTVAGIPTAISYKGIYINKDIRYDCHNLYKLLTPKYAIDWDEYFKLSVNMKLEPNSLHPVSLSSSLRVFAEAVRNRLDKIK